MEGHRDIIKESKKVSQRWRLRINLIGFTEISGVVKMTLFLTSHLRHTWGLCEWKLQFVTHFEL